jgi:Cu-Zn family superoxide dismutase
VNSRVLAGKTCRRNAIAPNVGRRRLKGVIMMYIPFVSARNLRGCRRVFVLLAVLGAGCSRSPDRDSSRTSSADNSGRASDRETLGAHGMATLASAEIEGRSGSTLSGRVTFTPAAGGGVGIVVDLTGAPPGTHGLHLHQNGDCSAADASSAGDHFNPTAHQHGAPGSGMHHAGDFGNIEVGPDGKGHLELTATDLTLDPGPNCVVGHAVVVHANRDDLQTQPSGNSGPRIGCGVVFAGAGRSASPGGSAPGR